MAHLTDDMRRLTAEIAGHRVDRDRLIRDVKHATAELKRGMAQALSSAHAARLAHTKEQQKHLRQFATHLNKTVTEMRTAFADDLAGAHGAWFGKPRTEARARGERAPERAHAKA